MMLGLQRKSGARDIALAERRRILPCAEIRSRYSGGQHCAGIQLMIYAAGVVVRGAFRRTAEEEVIQARVRGSGRCRRWIIALYFQGNGVESIRRDSVARECFAYILRGIVRIRPRCRRVKDRDELSVTRKRLREVAGPLQ